MTREVAAGRGYRATYMGRPDATMVGSGLHVNLSLMPIGGGPTRYDDPSDRHGLSELARQSIGGLIEHHEAVAGWSAPLVNSYKRLMPGLIAGYWANWGLDNRISTYRVPGERGRGDPDREPHAVRHAPTRTSPAAAMLNAALLGVAGGPTAAIPRSATATPSRTPTGTRRTRSPRRSTPSRPTRR